MHSESRYRQSDEAAEGGILVLDPETGMILDMNPVLLKMLNYSSADLLGKTMWEIALPKHEDACRRAFQELLEKGYVRCDDLPLIAKGGLLVSMEVTGRVYERKGGKLVQCNVRKIAVEEAIAPKLQIQPAQEVEAVGQIAGGLAHDLNNLLGVILGNCEILERQTALPEEIRKMVLEIHNAGASAKSLSQRLLAFSRGQAVQRVAVDLDETVRRTEGVLRRLAGDAIELITVPGGGLGSINADPSQLEQVLMNLTTNARDAMPEGGKILIETSNVEIDQSYTKEHSSMRPGRYVLLSVSDTGAGMNQETQSRIFEPFFTTKPFGQGTGLGLATVSSIVERSGGTISVRSQPGSGTTFQIFFPCTGRAPRAIEPAKAAPVRGGGETILLVDDAGTLRKLIRRLLEDGGYTVLDSGDPAVALCIAQEHPGPIPLLITDVVLPGMSGSEVAAGVIKNRPETRVLYVSGFNDESIVPLLVPGHSYAFLKKPFTQDELLKKVRQLLDSSIKIPARPLH